MYDKNNGSPRLGQRRRAIDGNGDGSGRFGCGMVHPQLLQAGAQLVSRPPAPADKASADDIGIRRPTNRASQSAKA